jgi:hypothetical protein
MDYPLKLGFKIIALAPQLSVRTMVLLERSRG